METIKLNLWFSGFTTAAQHCKCSYSYIRVLYKNIAQTDNSLYLGSNAKTPTPGHTRKYYGNSIVKPFGVRVYWGAVGE